jgi:hypothetical protein
MKQIKVLDKGDENKYTYIGYLGAIIYLLDMKYRKYLVDLIHKIKFI